MLTTFIFQMLQLFKFFFDDQVRAVAAGIIGPLFESLKLAHAGIQ